MPRHLDFFFYIGSTYTYLAVSRVEEMAARGGISLRGRPFNVRAIMLEQNNRPFIGKPVKLNCMWRDLERRANRYGIPFKSIPTYPVDPEELANRVAVVSSLEGWCPEYTKAPFGRAGGPVSSRPEIVCQVLFAVAAIEVSSGEPRRLSALR